MLICWNYVFMYVILINVLVISNILFFQKWLNEVTDLKVNYTFQILILMDLCLSYSRFNFFVFRLFPLYVSFLNKVLVIVFFPSSLSLHNIVYSYLGQICHLIFLSFLASPPIRSCIFSLRSEV